MRQPYQERVIAEQVELKDRIVKLRAFLRENDVAMLGRDEHDRLWQQFSLMNALSRVLQERIDAWSKPQPALLG